MKFDDPITVADIDIHKVARIVRTSTEISDGEKRVTYLRLLDEKGKTILKITAFPAQDPQSVIAVEDGGDEYAE